MTKLVNKWGEPTPAGPKPVPHSYNMNGGSKNDVEQYYYLKYLKYKNKYLKLKNK